jgi:5-methylcytosine-specific restriction protein A
VSISSSYGSKWQKARLDFLSKNPLCVEHGKRGLVVAATVVDHIVAHKNDLKLFWDRKNWQALCKHCHDSHKQRLEKSGVVIGCALNGVPIDSNHHWNK